MGGWEESVCLTAGERAKCGAKAGDRDAMWPETCNPEHSCAASATRATAASHIRANSQAVCVCAAAVCFLVLLLPRSCSRPAKSLEKKKCREWLLFSVHTSATSPRLPPPILWCCSALGRHPAPRTRHCAAKHVRPRRTFTEALTSRRSTVL
jgi:hypothetical protein